MGLILRLIYFIIIANAFLFAKDGVIKGKVTDSLNGSALIGANVVVEGTYLGAATAARGEYIIKELDPGTYTIMASYIGYESYKETINLNLGQKLSKDLALKPEAIEMETYVVTASRRRERVEDAPAAISVISKREIRRESNTNLGDYLKGTKGIDFTQSGIDSYNMTARGFNSSFSSRTIAISAVSFFSIFPPGNSHKPPIVVSLGRFDRSILPSTSIRAQETTTFISIKLYFKTQLR